MSYYFGSKVEHYMLIKIIPQRFLTWNFRFPFPLMRSELPFSAVPGKLKYCLLLTVYLFQSLSAFMAALILPSSSSKSSGLSNNIDFTASRP